MQRKGKRSESPELVLKHRSTSGNKLLSWARMIFELCCEYHEHDRANRGKFATWNKWVVKELEMLDLFIVNAAVGSLETPPRVT